MIVLIILCMLLIDYELGVFFFHHDKGEFFFLLLAALSFPILLFVKKAYVIFVILSLGLILYRGGDNVSLLAVLVFSVLTYTVGIYCWQRRKLVTNILFFISHSLFISLFCQFLFRVYLLWWSKTAPIYSKVLALFFDEFFLFFVNVSSLWLFLLCLFYCTEKEKEKIRFLKHHLYTVFMMMVVVGYLFLFPLRVVWY